MEVPYKKKAHPNGFLMSTAAVGGEVQRADLAALEPWRPGLSRTRVRQVDSSPSPSGTASRNGPNLWSGKSASPSVGTACGLGTSRRRDQAKLACPVGSLPVY